MSKEQAQAFVQKVADDKELQAQLQSPGVTKEQVLAIARESGFIFTLEDLLAVIPQTGATQGELSDEELLNIAGGCPGSGSGVNCW